VDAFCFKCKEKREIKDPKAEFNKQGSAVTTGTCGVCGTKMYRMGRTPEHDSLPQPEKVGRHALRSGKLVIVESPAKARTVGRFLGKGYTVKASVGHVRDLYRSEMSVDIENNFAPKYRVPNEKRVVVKELKELVKHAEEVYLATDPDREGEAISWHLMEAANISPALSKRVVFHEITKTAIDDAFAHPRKINMDLVNAQQGRRILDRLVGFSISPILWEKVRSRLSAGRVQSVALRLIVDREREIDAFNPVEYWSIAAEFRPEGLKSNFTAKLGKIDDADPVLGSQAVVDPIIQDLEGASYAISRIKKSERRRKPSAPFITSTMQQEASRRLGYTAKRTMAIAQQLYEGVEIGEGGATGLITYMRTDSINIAEQAQAEAREYINKRYGADFLPAAPPQYKTRAVGAQEAHEAIRPTSANRTPEAVKEFLSSDQFKLYQLVWQRFMASQMEAAIYDTQNQKLVKLLPEQHFTQPPPRYTDASLIQALEEYGIGRPSTYAPILSTIQDRGYVYREAKRLFPTETGIQVNDLLVEYFPEIVDMGFTARMEANLDKVAGGHMKWEKTISEFYTPFAVTLKHAQAEMPVTKAELEKVGRACPDCGKDLVIRWGRYGKFISCSGFPECRHTEAWLEKIGVTCPKDGGDVVKRKTRKGRVFFGCANYPNCDFTTWKEPLAIPCPNCKGMLVVANKREAQCLDCEETFLLENLSTESTGEPEMA